MTKPICFANFPDINEDISAQSKSYHFKTSLSFINKAILNELIELGNKEKTNARISMHSSSDNLLHNMIIMQQKGTYNRPHKHPQKAEAYHLIYGEEIIIIFNSQGDVIDKCFMSLQNHIIYRFEKDLFHMSIPISDMVIFHESKIGPFVRKGDSVFPDWAPAVDKTNEIDWFIKNIGVI